jgi:uncharacterized protein YjbJ (UPF0337 family)
MGILDKARQALGGVKEKAADLTHDHSDRITGAIDKAGDLVDKTTKGRYADKIDDVQAKAKQAVTKFGERVEAPGDTAVAGDAPGGEVHPGETAPSDDTEGMSGGDVGPGGNLGSTR